MSFQPSSGCIIAAPQSGSGKTLITLGLLRALKRAGLAVISAKVGPDYLDPAFHSHASGSPCVNLDLWAMGSKQVHDLTQNDAFQLIEGVMGLFDGADNGSSSTADLAAFLDLPVILVVDASRQSQSVAALLQGFKIFRRDITLAGVIFNKVGSERHETLLREAAEKVELPCFGAVRRLRALKVKTRHLGLVQAGEHAALDQFIDKVATIIEDAVDLRAVYELRAKARTKRLSTGRSERLLPPLGQRIAIAQDDAFGFIYPHLIFGFREQGAEILPFSPLSDQAPDPDIDAVFLPGGYPELHAGRLATCRHFLTSLQALNDKVLIYGECGGFMVLGERLIDHEGVAHQMAGLLPVVTSFETPRLHLGYRQVTHQSMLPWPKTLRGHEFHYSTLLSKPAHPPLFEVENSLGERLPSAGVARGLTIASYVHIIAAEDVS